MVLNILYLPTRYFPSISGAEFYLQRMAEILSRKYSYKINISTSNAIDFRALRDPKGKYIKQGDLYYDQVNGLKVNRFPVDYTSSAEDKLNFFKKFNEFKTLDLSEDLILEFLKNGPYIPDLINTIMSDSVKRYNLIHTTFFPYLNTVISLMIGKKYSIPVIITPFFHFSNPRYMNLKISALLEKFNIIIACTNKEKEVLIKNLEISPNKIQVIPMGVDYEEFNHPKINRNKNYRFKDNYFKKKVRNSQMVLFCGYKNYEKGALSLLKAIPLIIDKKPNTYFVLIGPSTTAYNREISKIKKLPNVKIINLTPDNLNGYFDKKKISAFKETDVYVMPSRSDAFGIAFLEAWASGKPVIGANIGATPEVIENNKDGLLVEFDNPKDIATKILCLLKSKKMRKKLGAAGKEKVKERFTWNLIAQKTNELYQNLIK